MGRSYKFCNTAWDRVRSCNSCRLELPFRRTIPRLEEASNSAFTPRHPKWAEVSSGDWDDWRWQSRNSIRSVEQLRELLPFTDSEVVALERLGKEYKVAIPPYYFSLIDPATPNDPIRRQSVPSPQEAENPSGYALEDPLEEDQDSPVRGLTHRYPDRALLVTTPICTMYCRFCTRKRTTMVQGGWDAISRDDHRMIDYVKAHSEIRDVILSGGIR